jgi:hypothetical protein
MRFPSGPFLSPSLGSRDNGLGLGAFIPGKIFNRHFKWMLKEMLAEKKTTKQKGKV